MSQNPFQNMCRFEPLFKLFQRFKLKRLAFTSQQADRFSYRKSVTSEGDHKVTSTDIKLSEQKFRSAFPQQITAKILCAIVRIYSNGIQMPQVSPDMWHELIAQQNREYANPVQ